MIEGQDIPTAEDAVRALKNREWQRGGCEEVERISRLAAKCPFCGCQNERVPLPPDGCIACGKDGVEWIVERRRQAGGKP